MAVTPNSVVTPQNVKHSTAVCTAAKTDLSNNTNAVRLLAAASNVNGVLVKRVYAIPRGTSVATQLQLFTSKDAGVTLSFSNSALLPAYTNSNNTRVEKGEFTDITADFPARLEAGEELWCGTGVALTAGIVFHVEYEAF